MTLRPRKQANLVTQSALPHHIIPTCASQALQVPEWKAAMSVEFEALVKQGTLDLVPTCPGQIVVGCKWVYIVKYKPDGSLDRFKARLVAKGFHQRPGVDYSETFSPVIKPVTIRVVLTIALSHGWQINQLDVNNAFLHGTLHEEVYMKQHLGFNDGSGSVCRLLKSIYGLKQAPRVWYQSLSGFLLSFGFHQSVSDASLFILSSHQSYIYVLVYVDDIIVTGSTPTLVRRTIDSLAQKFSIKDLGSLHYFLGM
ncbi:unnamed protein product [Cuscuta europaea]|uniref:Reverse transcriptase Ty1/copia-type domain-containing protein n=1 Tax=Cuscuta europaea TaxID=41803 RepID=A0A9P0VML9_CUSEU|nr:unnamed protein product [Cuscuta europaea]